VWRSAEPMTLLLAWLRLLRLPNHATAVADVLAGFLIVSQSQALQWPAAPLWWAIAASVCFYGAGMVLNDVLDLELDRTQRPERPLPSGLIDAQTAATVANRLFTIGSVCACGAAFVSGQAAVALVGAGLTAAVWTYDRYAKHTPWGPIAMGSCRSLNWLLGMTAAGGPDIPHQWLLPAGMGLYVAGITLYARNEAGQSRSAALLLATLTMLMGLLAAGSHTWLMAQGGDGSLWLRNGHLPSWCLLWGVLGASILLRSIFGILDPTSRRVQAAVGNAIMSIITLDAVLVLAACGQQWAVIVLILLVPFFFGRQVVAAT